MADENGATVYDPKVAPSGQIRAAPAPGTRIGKYVVEKTLGSGGMGVVVAAHNVDLRTPVAIKLMNAKAAKDSTQAERFAREARQTSRIKSEHVVKVIDTGVDETSGAPFIVMEYMEGRDLGRVVSEDGPLPFFICIDYMMQVCEAVAAAHALGIVHRDLKPSNFFLTTGNDGSPLVKVLDFGISKALVTEDMDAAKLTETQAVFGSPTYMSPEQIRSAKHVDQRSDVWSLGIAMFEMISGKLPFMADNVAGLLASIVADPPFRLSMLAGDVPEALENVVHRCLEKDPTRRVQSVAELAAMLRPFASQAAEAAVLTGRIERIARHSISGPLTNPRSIPPPGSSQPSHPAPALDFSKTTGTDLSATGPSGKRGKSGMPLVAVAIAVFAVTVGLFVGVVVLARSAKSTATAEAPPPAVTSVAMPATATAAAPLAPTVLEATSAVAVASATPASNGRTKIRGKSGGVSPNATAASASPPAAAPAPPTARPDTTDSRY